MPAPKVKPNIKKIMDLNQESVSNAVHSKVGSNSLVSPETVENMIKNLEWPDATPNPPGIFYAISGNKIEDVWK